MSLPLLFAQTELFLTEHKVPADHGWSHAIAVAGNAASACLEEDITMSQTECVIAAAVLHDVDDRKFFKRADDSAPFPNARKLLTGAGYEGEEFDLIIEMISLVSASTVGNSVIEPRWKLIPRDADRVEAMGKIGIERCHAYTCAQKRPVALENTPCPVTDEELAKVDVATRFQQYVATKGSSASMIDHFYDKLLAMMLESRNGHLGVIATERLRVMKDWLYRANHLRLTGERSMVELPAELKVW